MCQHLITVLILEFLLRSNGQIRLKDFNTKSTNFRSLAQISKFEKGNVYFEIMNQVAVDGGISN